MNPEIRARVEAAVLCGLLFQPGKLDDLAGVLRPEHFESPRHASWLQAMLAISERHEPVDVTTLTLELEKSGGARDPELRRSLIAMFEDGYLEAAHVDHYVRALLTESRRLRVAELSRRIASGEELDDELLDELRDQIAPKEAPRESLGSLARSMAERSIAGISLADGLLQTPWEDLNASIMGLEQGTLTLVAARPGRGKTVFITSIALHAATKGHPVLFFSLEMNREGLVTRILSAISSIDHTWIRKGWVPPADRDQLRSAAEVIASMPLELNDCGGLSIQKIRALATKHKENGGLALIVVDYAQLASDPKSERRLEEMASVSRGLKEMAKELRVPVLSAVQLNRQGDSEKPRLSHIRECGQFEQDADTILFLWLDEEQEKADSPLVEVWVPKNRQGPGATVQLQFQKNRCRMVAPAPYAEVM